MSLFEKTTEHKIQIDKEIIKLEREEQKDRENLCVNLTHYKAWVY